MNRDPVDPDAKSLEDAFFAKQDAALLEKLKEQARTKERRDALREVAPHADDALLDHFIALGLSPETVLAVILVPLAAVAWADGSIDAREKEAVLRGAAERGIAPGTPAHALLSGWLERPPSPALMAAWKRYVAAMWTRFDADEKREMHGRLIGMAREVAESAGGFLGLGRKVSAPEQAVLDTLEKSLS
jgi:hypothetical protein